MREFFRGWRRTVGCATLVMACALMGMWLRSRVVNDFLATDGRDATYRIGSYGGAISFIRDTPAVPFERFLHLDSFDEGDDNKYELWKRWDSWDGYEMSWRWDLAQFHFGVGSTGSASRTESYTFPYWFFVIPITLLSAYLILWKSRKRSSPI
jgi:hypothetical protein